MKMRRRVWLQLDPSDFNSSNQEFIHQSNKEQSTQAIRNPKCGNQASPQPSVPRPAPSVVASLLSHPFQTWTRLPLAAHLPDPAPLLSARIPSRTQGYRMNLPGWTQTNWT